MMRSRKSEQDQADNKLTDEFVRRWIGGGDPRPNPDARALARKAVEALTKKPLSKLKVTEKA